jgi:hypothetical protein
MRAIEAQLTPRRKRHRIHRFSHSSSIWNAMTVPAALPRRAIAALYSAVAFVYLVAFPYHPALRSPNELCRLWQSRSLVEQGTLDINAALREYGPVGDLSVKDGKYYPSKAPLLSFAAAPIYFGLKAWARGDGGRVPEVPQVFWSRLLLTVLPTLLMLVFVRRFLLAYVAPAAADVVVVSYALGSLAFSYALMFVSHQITAVLVFGAFYGLFRLERQQWRPRGYLVAGAFAGAAVACEYTAALPLIILAVYCALGYLADRSAPLTRRVAGLARAAVISAIGALPFVAGLLWYHQAAFGHPLDSGYKYLADAAYQGWHVGGFLGIRLPQARAFALSFFSPLRGLFALSPCWLLALPGLWLMWRGPRERWLTLRWLSLLQLCGFAYFTSAFSYASWGWASGPRHMTPLLPFLLLPVALAIDRAIVAERHRPWYVGIAAGLCVASIWITGSIAMINYIPDTLSSALFAAVLPLMRAGYFVPSVLGFFGIANPSSGASIWAVVLLSGALTGACVVRLARERWLLSLAVSLAVVGLAVGWLAAATRHDRADREAERHLRRDWMAPPGVQQRFWH